jgi:hypothetical protein
MENIRLQLKEFAGKASACLQKNNGEVQQPVRRQKKRIPDHRMLVCSYLITVMMATVTAKDDGNTEFYLRCAFNGMFTCPPPIPTSPTTK